MVEQPQTTMESTPQRATMARAMAPDPQTFGFSLEPSTIYYLIKRRADWECNP
jgi:hypothetical protein